MTNLAAAGIAFCNPFLNHLSDDKLLDAKGYEVNTFLNHLSDDKRDQSYTFQYQEFLNHLSDDKPRVKLKQNS